jgi:hypothetical protein
MNAKATDIAKTALLNWYYDIGFEEEQVFTAEEMKETAYQIVEDNCEEYDESWFQIICVDRKSPCVDWEEVARAVQEQQDTQDGSECDDDDEDVTQKKCYNCGERKSCGNYNACKEWYCDECQEDQDECSK